MDNINLCVNLLEENKIETYKNAIEHLKIIFENILKFPLILEHRQVYLSDPEVEKNLLSATGALESLFIVGFVEKDDHVVLPFDESLSKLKYLYNLICVKPLPPTNDNNFLKEIISHVKIIKLHESKSLQEMARKEVPITELEIKAMNTMRRLQRNIKSKELEQKDDNLSVLESGFKHFFLLELMKWFKYSYFHWFDKPKCDSCFIECKFETTKYCPNNTHYSRLEVYKCKNCQKIINFPRYVHPKALLKSKSGRCGEWANVFTLICKSLGYDARFIIDKTDHVWTEVWSEIEKRWVHVDCCEDILDQPLMYEKGWNKKLTYVLAFSKDEVQDVTWRYTTETENVMKRRKLCPEDKLSSFLISLNDHLQSKIGYSEARKKYVLKRRAFELADLLTLPNANKETNENYNQRTSGSLAWRQARGECTSETLDKCYIWNLNPFGEEFRIIYNIVTDVYKVMSFEKVISSKSGLENGIYSMKGLFRKVENDWNKVYVARNETVNSGNISWTFETKRLGYCLEWCNIKVKTGIFEDGEIVWTLYEYYEQSSTDPHQILTTSNSVFGVKFSDGVTKFTVTATLLGGKGDLAWQHAQLFREDLNNIDSESMVTSIKLKPNIV